jgi:hypothetical protein
MESYPSREESYAASFLNYSPLPNSGPAATYSNNPNFIGEPMRARDRVINGIFAAVVTSAIVFLIAAACVDFCPDCMLNIATPIALVAGVIGFAVVFADDGKRTNSTVMESETEPMIDQPRVIYTRPWYGRFAVVRRHPETVYVPRPQRQTANYATVGHGYHTSNSHAQHGRSNPRQQHGHH